MQQSTADFIKKAATRTIAIQEAAIAALQNSITQQFMEAVETIAACKGRLVVSGIGKSAIVAQKIVATLNSTGTPALFMHAADAVHGDLGMIREEDIVMVISKSGDSPEIKLLAPLLKNFGNTLIGMVGNLDSYLAVHSDIIIDAAVEQEACPNNLAPTTSTTAQMVMGDALAICLMELKGFKADDFAKFHPGGVLGKKLYLRVSDLIGEHEKPFVSADEGVKNVIVAITKHRLGAVAVTDDKNSVIGVITDGDIRRMLEKHDAIGNLSAKNIMSASPKKIELDALAAEALEAMRTNNISQLLAEQNGRYAGIIHLHDLIREGII